MAFYRGGEYDFDLLNSDKQLDFAEQTLHRF